MKNVLIIVGVVVIGVLLFGWNRFFGSDQAEDAFAYWQNTTVRCIPGHQNLAFHFHPKLQILVNGSPETIPANVGIALACMAEVHTHDASGTLHIEGIDARDFHLQDFFSVWDRPLTRDGFTLTPTVDGSLVQDIGSLKLADGQQIILDYKSAE